MNSHENARLTPKGRELLSAAFGRGEQICDGARAPGQKLRVWCIPRQLLCRKWDVFFHVRW